MAKRQNFIVGSTNVITQSLTDSELNHGFDQYEILTADELDGVFNSVSDFSNDSSNEIANAIQSITGSQPTGASQTELAAALQQMRSEIETTSLTFKGYVATSAPSSSTYALVEGNLWINSSTMPTSFPVAASSIKRWNGTSWVNYGSTYTPADFDFFRNINDNEGYYWFGGIWTVMSTDMSSTYFTLNQSTGKWEIKSSVNLPGAPTIATAPAATDNSKKIATTSSVRAFRDTQVSNCIIGLPRDITIGLDNNGTLTVYAGSVVHVADGDLEETYSIPNNVTRTSIHNGTYVAIMYNNASVFLASIEGCFSGTLANRPASIATTTGMYYATDEKKIYTTSNSGSTWTHIATYSLPIAIITVSGGAISKVNHVFNGFGYIGSTVFVLPGVEGLIPNGRNSVDGTLKNTYTKTTQVITGTYTGTAEVYFGFASGTGDVYFYSQSNYNYNFQTNYSNWSTVVLGGLKSNAGVFSAYTPKQVVAIPDYNDSVLRYGSQRINGEKTMSGANSFRFIGNNSYGTIFRASNERFYMLLTDQNDPDGDWNSMRPFSLDCATGTITTTTPATTDKSDKIATTNYTRSLLETIYPVGSLYFGTQSTCPLASLFGTWTRVPSGYAIWTGNGTSETNSNTPNGTTTNANYANAKPNTTIAAGVPNLTGTFKANATTMYETTKGHITDTTGVFSAAAGTNSHLDGGDGGTNTYGTVTFDASQNGTDTIYGKSSTVQPPAYIVNVWRRTA